MNHDMDGFSKMLTILSCFTTEGQEGARRTGRSVADCFWVPFLDSNFFLSFARLAPVLWKRPMVGRSLVPGGDLDQEMFAEEPDPNLLSLRLD